MLKEPKVKFEAVKVRDSGIRDKQACNLIKKEMIQSNIYDGTFLKNS